MLTAKKITKQDLPLLKQAAQQLAREKGKGTVREAMRKISVKGNTTYGIFSDDALVGWKVVNAEGRVVSEMGITSLDNGGLPVFADSEALVSTPVSDMGFAPMPVSESASAGLHASVPSAGAPAAADHPTAQDPFENVPSFASDERDDPFEESDPQQILAADLLHNAERSAKAMERYGSGSKRARQLAQDPFKHPENSRATSDVSSDGFVPVAASSSSKPKMSLPKIVLGCILAALVLTGAFFSVYTAYQQLVLRDAAQTTQDAQLPELDWSLYSPADPGSLVHVQVISGMTPIEICELLAENGLVECAQEFMTQVEAQEAYSSLTAGEYIVPADEPAASLVSRMVSGKRVPDGVIGVNHGDTLSTISAAIDKAGVPYNGGDFLNAASDVAKWRQMFSMLAEVPENLPTVEGYIASDEYDLSRTSTAAEAIEKMLAPIQEMFELSGMSSREFHDMLTKASLIEKEALFDEDRPLISSVIDNRLQAGAPLQIDAAVKYANNYDEARVYDSHLEIDSPYNTYMYAGLPVGPICSGIAQVDIDAARNPAQTDYFYYVLQDTEGHHRFCVTPEEFEIAKQEYLQLFGYEE